MEKIPLTTAGYKMLSNELEKRMSKDRRRIVNAISEARAHGDLSENAEYHAAKEEQGHNEGRIQELESILTLAQVIDVTKLSGNNVKFGATVSIVDEDTDEETSYQIVGNAEADINENRVSISSPIARAMIGKETGDSFEVAAPGGSRGYEILAVKYI